MTAPLGLVDQVLRKKEDKPTHLDTGENSVIDAIEENDRLLREAKAELHTLVGTLQGGFQPALDMANRVDSSINDIASALDSVTSTLHGSKSGGIHHYVEGQQEQKRLAQEIQTQTLRVQALTTLASIGGSFTACDKALKDNAFDVAAREVTKLTTLAAEIRKPACIWRSSHITKSVLDGAKLRHSMLTQRVSGLFWKSVNLVDGTASMQLCTVKKGTPVVPMKVIVDALESTGGLTDIVKTFCEKVTSMFRKAFPDGSSSVGLLQRSVKGKGHIVLTSKAPEAGSNSSNSCGKKNDVQVEMVNKFKKLLANFEAVLTFTLSDCFAENKTAAEIVQKHLWSEIHHEALSKYVLLTLPPSTSGKTFADTYPEGHGKMLQCAKAFDKVTNGLGLTLNSFEDVVGDIDIYVAANRRNSVLGQSRVILLRETFDPVKAHTVYRSGTRNSSNVVSGARDPFQHGFFHFPECSISEVARDIVDQAYALFLETLTTTGVTHATLLSTAVDVFELYRAIVPVRHAKSITTVAQISAIHHNDLMYIAHNIVAVLHVISRQDESPADTTAMSTLLALVPTFRAMAEKVLQQQVDRQITQMKDAILATHGFADVSKPANEKAVKIAFSQVTHQFNLLGKVWGPGVLPSAVYTVATGYILSQVLECVCEQILAIPNIAGEERILLQQMCKQLVPLQAVIRPPSLTDLPTLVPAWSKFVTVVEIMALDAAGIRQMQSAGDLASIPQDQLDHFLSALGLH